MNLNSGDPSSIDAIRKMEMELDNPKKPRGPFRTNTNILGEVTKDVHKQIESPNPNIVDNAYRTYYNVYYEAWSCYHFGHPFIGFFSVNDSRIGNVGLMELRQRFPLIIDLISPILHNQELTLKRLEVAWERL